MLGAGLGAMAALRGRYHFSQWKKLPRLFPNGLQGGPNPEVMRERIGLFTRTIAFSMGGVVIGQSAGFLLGTWRSTQIIKAEGNFENIEKVMKRVQQDIRDNYGKANEGREDAYGNQGRSLPPAQRRKLQGVPQEDARDYSQETSRLEKPFVSDSATGAEQAWNDTSFAKDVGPGGDGFYGSAQTSRAPPPTSAPAASTARRSRWEELRGAKDSRDSAWEKIRQDNAREQWQSSSSASASSISGAGILIEDRPASEMFNEDRKREEDERRRALTKERERREYEKMFERESKGVDSL